MSNWVLREYTFEHMTAEDFRSSWTRPFRAWWTQHELADLYYACDFGAIALVLTDHPAMVEPVPPRRTTRSNSSGCVFLRT
jgi:hypothetical protein